MTAWYDWKETFTYDADVTFVASKRNIGKTFGLREQFLRDYIKAGWRFVSVSRYANAIADIADGFFSKIEVDTKDEKLRAWFDTCKPKFRMRNKNMEIVYTDENGEKVTDTIGYFAYMSVKQNAKNRTFTKVRRIVFDEAIIEVDDLRYNGYLSNEWERLVSIVNSCTREQEDGVKPNVYLLSNTCHLLNPWFQMLGINELPEYGKHWYRGKTVLFDFVDPGTVRADMQDTTVAGRMSKGTMEGMTAYGNTLAQDYEFLAKKPKRAMYECGFIYKGQMYCIWTDYEYGVSYVLDRFVKNLGCPMYALTTRDNKVQYFAAMQARKALMNMVERYGLGAMRFESIALREGFLAMLRDFGVK